MNAYESILIAIVGGSAVLGYVLLLVQSARQHRRICTMQKQLEVFVDTSINVARCVDRLTHEGGSREVANVASRRWVLREARNRLDQGENITEIAAPLGLSRDEVRLLGGQAAGTVKPLQSSSASAI